jgi:hypothetical protein
VQGGEGIRVTGPATPGGSITVQTGAAAGSIEIGVLGTNESTRHDVSSTKNTTIPVPSVPPGTVLVIRVGRGNRRRRILITVVSPSP